MWNLRSQNLKHWFLGQELYIRVYDSDPNPAKEYLPPKTLLYCGNVQAPPPTPPPSPNPVPAPPASAATITTIKRQWVHIIVTIFVVLII
nr:PREDICTED: monocopper oxidase-like protein SKS2 [Nicotiana sylvestris]XP_016443820.1 PREDICTED: monocopper oxidase-like protein SKS2 [Nicotiana tabacum]